MPISEPIRHEIRISSKKTEMPIGLNRSSSKANCRRIEFSNLAAPGNAVSAPRFKF